MQNFNTNMKRYSETGLTEDLVKSQQSIRKKYKRLKLKNEANSQYLQKSFQPITEPLNTIIKSNTAIENIAKLLQPKKILDNSTYTDTDTMKYFDTAHSEEEERHKYDAGERNEIVIDPLLKKFFTLHQDPRTADDLDKVYGIRSDGQRWLLGDSPIDVSNDKIIVKGKMYQGTPGLYELLFLKQPNENIYTADDLEIYKEMVLATNAHRQRYASGRQINSNKGTKYNTIIKALVQRKSGTGVNLNSVRYEYWDDPNELVGRLRLLIASQQAGNTSVNNEIISIIEELREAGIIE